MKRTNLELTVGLFVLVGIAALGYLSINLGRVELWGRRGYTVYGDFPTVGGLKTGSSVEIAGVEVGRVESIRLANYTARVTFHIHEGVKLQEDTIASIKTKGLIGEKYVRLSPGGSERLIQPGGRIREVEPPVDLEELIGKYIFGQVE